LSAYIDTSALAKCYIREPRSFDVLDWLDSEDSACICSLTIIEFRCLLARRRRSGSIGGEIEAAALARWQDDIDGGMWRLERLEHEDYNTARQMIDRLPTIPLRALDALHLAAAQNASCRDFLTADRNQAAAAAMLGFAVHTFFDVSPDTRK
jgi:uncharacterized protein